VCAWAGWLTGWPLGWLPGWGCTGCPDAGCSSEGCSPVGGSDEISIEPAGTDSRTMVSPHSSSIFKRPECSSITSMPPFSSLPHRRLLSHVAPYALRYIICSAVVKKSTRTPTRYTHTKGSLRPSPRRTHSPYSASSCADRHDFRGAWMLLDVASVTVLSRRCSGKPLYPASPSTTSGTRVPRYYSSRMFILSSSRSYWATPPSPSRSTPTRTCSQA
jgi:hypothetical protein